VTLDPLPGRPVVKLTLKLLGGLNDFIARVAMAVAMIIIAITVVALFGGAITRYLTGIGYDWVLEFPPMMVPWLVFPLLGVLLRRGQHIGVDFLPGKLSVRGSQVLRLTCNIIAFLAALTFFYAGLDAVSLFKMLGQVTEMEFEFPIWYMYLSFPVGFALLASFSFELVLMNISDLSQGVSGPGSGSAGDGR
jgi:TRAP-type C4-dicarboxylate transport system permease small subunit